MIRLVRAELHLMEAAVAGDDSLARELGRDVVAGWATFTEALQPTRDALAANPDGSAWGARFFVAGDPPEVVGWGGFKGPPKDGVVELGYEIAEVRRGRGLATAATRAMLVEAFTDERVTAVTAHTLAERNASNRVLEKAGFRYGGEALEDGEVVWCFSFARPALLTAGRSLNNPRSASSRAGAGYRRDVEIRVGDYLLRPPRRADLPAVVAACRDPEIPRFIPYIPVPYTQQVGRTWLAGVERRWRSSDERTFAIVNESDRLLGVVTIRLRDGGSIGFWLSREARAKGVMTRAVKAVVEWARSEHGIERLCIIAHLDNVASQRVAEKAGFVRVGLTPHEPPFRDGSRNAVRFDLA